MMKQSKEKYIEEKKTYCNEKVFYKSQKIFFFFSLRMRKII